MKSIKATFQFNPKTENGQTYLEMQLVDEQNKEIIFEPIKLNQLQIRSLYYFLEQYIEEIE